MACWTSYTKENVGLALKSVGIMAEGTIAIVGATNRDAMIFVLAVRLVLAMLAQIFDVDVGHSPHQVLEDAQRAIEG